MGEIFHAVGQKLFLIGVPEEAGVVEASTQHPLVAVDDQAIGIAVRVRNRHELRGEMAVRRFDREVFLVETHHGREDFFRQRE